MVYNSSRVKPESEGSSTTMFRWREKDDIKQVGYTVWSIFPHDTKYFDPSASPFMINFRVKDLDRLLDQLMREGVKVDDKREEYPYGKFGWIIDPEATGLSYGNRRASLLLNDLISLIMKPFQKN